MKNKIKSTIHYAHIKVAYSFQFQLSEKNIATASISTFTHAHMSAHTLSRRKIEESNTSYHTETRRYLLKCMGDFLEKKKNPFSSIQWMWI